MRSRRRLLRALGPALLLSVGGAYAIGSWNWCGTWEVSPPVLERTAVALGSLRAGAARTEIRPPYPVIPAGYSPPRLDLSSAVRPLQARAVVLEVPPLRVGIVSLDALSPSDDVVQRIRAIGDELGLSDVWVAATHAHSAMGGYDQRLIAQVAGIGRFREDSRDALVDAAADALRRASAALTPVELRVGTADAPGLVYARSGDAADSRLTRMVFTGPERDVAEIWIWSAHPTLVSRPVSSLSPDYPGWIEAGETPVLLLQGAVGNASASVAEGEGAAPERYARALSDAARAVEVAPSGEVFLGLSRARAHLPRPDASRLVPDLVRAASDNLLCGSASHEAEVAALRLGALTLLAIPGEPSAATARLLEEKSGATRTLSVANGYLGYMEPGPTVRERGGESKRQYYGPELVDALAQAAQLAVEAVTPKR